MRRVLPALILLGCAAGVWALVPPAPVAAAPTAPPIDAEYEQTIKPFLNTYCNKCHNSDKNAGGVPLDIYTGTDHAKKDRKVWETVLRVVADGEMPPKNKPQPPKAEKDAFAGWIENKVTKFDCTSEKNPGRVTLRRLNRAEYNNTVRDLVGIDFTPADDFPSDDVGYGFDNIGDVLSVQPILVEKYMAAADKILEAAIPNLPPIKLDKQTFRPQTLQTIPRSARKREKDDKGREKVSITLTTEGAAFVEKHHFPADGEYALRVRVWGQKAGDEAAKASVRIDGKDQKTFAVTAAKEKPEVLEVKVKVLTGDRRVAVVLANPTADTKAKETRALGVEFLEIEGPFGTASRPLGDAAKKILVAQPKTDAEARKAAEQVLAAFARKAFRRPVKPEEIARLLKLFDVAHKQGDAFDQAVKLPLKAVLVSPHFLFRVEADPANPEDAKPLSEHELATRLSYFVWSTMPDEELFRLAETGQLRKNLPAQVKRMLKDPKAKALTDNFAGQWLMLRSVKGFTPDTGRFKTWDESLRSSIIRETEMTFEYVVKEDRSVLEFLDADYTFLNERLAKHYGIAGVKGDDFRKVALTDKNRGGLLTQASVLAVTSNPTRTSPVKRGKWVLENLLGAPPPPPAPEVPELPPVGQIKGTLRQQMEQHRANPSCANCHSKLDPLGFGLENFDAVGAWRAQDNGQNIDASGVLPDGKSFAGPAELKKVLLGKADQFRRCLAEKLLTFGLGRGMEYHDRCVLDDVTKKLAAGGDKFSALVLAVVESDPFQKRRGKRSE